MERESGAYLRGYASAAHAGRRLLVRAEQRDALVAGLGEHQDWEPAGTGGREQVFRFPLSDGAAIVREYRRGGIMRFLTRDAFLFVNRPLREVAVHEYLYRAGLPVPEPLGVAWERRGPLIRGAIATREVKAVHLQEYLHDADASPAVVLGAAGAAIREMHDLGVYHADMQIRNILVDENGVFLIDFDNARRYGRLSRWKRARNLLRLRRSFSKNGFERKLYEAVLNGYGPLRILRVLDIAYSLRGRLSDLFRRRSIS